MAEQKMEIPYQKSPQWRAIAATVANVGSISAQGGMEVQLRFAYEWTDIQAEKVNAEVTKDAKGMLLVTKSGVELVSTSLYKMEEVAVRMAVEPAVGLVVALLTQFAFYPPSHALSDQLKKRIEDAYLQLQKA